MQKKSDKQSKLSLESKVSLLASILTILWILSNWIPSYQKTLKLLSESIGTSSMLLQLLILLTLFVMLTLFLSLRCIFKFNNKTKHSNLPIQTDKTYPIPINIMNEILLLIKNTENFSISIAKHKLEYTDKQLREFLDVLVNDEFVYIPKNSHNEKPLFKTYKLKAKGYNYLIFKSLI